MKDRDREEDREREYRSRDPEPREGGTNGDDRKGIYESTPYIPDLPLMQSTDREELPPAQDDLDTVE